jgi:hypothetical protein
MSAKRMSPLPFLDVAGGPYALGYALGRFGEAAVHNYLQHTPAWSTVMGYRGSPVVAAMAQQLELRFPRYWEELRGLADGLSLPLEDVFLWNCRGDLWAMAPDGCTTVQIPGRSSRWIGHNEDGDPGLAESCALARLVPDDGPAFTVFVYPGSLPGHTFAVTDQGLVQAVNNIRALVGGDGVPRMAMARASLDAMTLDEAVDLICATPRAGAFHVTLAQAGDPRLLSIEFTAGRFSAREVQTTSAHANHLVHDGTADLAQIVTGSSGDRQARADALCAESGDVAEYSFALRLLGDQAASGLPIYRPDPADPDGENTLASAVFHILPNRIEWEVYRGPQRSPDFRFSGGLLPDPP